MEPRARAGAAAAARLRPVTGDRGAGSTGLPTSSRICQRFAHSPLIFDGFRISVYPRKLPVGWGIDDV